MCFTRNEIVVETDVLQWLILAMFRFCILLLYFFTRICTAVLILPPHANISIVVQIRGKIKL